MKKIVLSGAALLLFSFECRNADVPPDDAGSGNPGNGNITDDHGNMRASATPVTSGTPVAGNIETGDDQDYFSIRMPGGVRLRAAATGNVNTIGHIYDSSGRELAANDDDGEGMNFNVSTPIATAGTYYVRVTSRGMSTGGYRLTVTSIPDDHGNTRASATPVTIGMAINGEIDPGTDVDYFSIRVTATDLAGIDFLILRAMTTGVTNTIGHLYNSDGNELAADDNSGTDTNFDISYIPPSPGTYYLRVEGMAIGMYRLTVTSTDGDHGNTRGSATPVTSGAAITGNINPGTDPDYFSIEVTSTELSGRGSLLLKAATNGSLDTVGHLYDSFGRELDMDDDTFGINFWFSHRITTAGTYYVRVTSEGTNTGMYDLTVTFDDHSELRAQATPVTVGTPIAGNIETTDDQDYFSITVTSADLASADALELRAITTGSTDTTGYLYDSDGNQLAFDFDNGADTNFEISYAITTAGTYYIEVINNVDNTGMYHVTVTTTAGDHGNDRGSATPVRSGTAVTGNINPGTDEDWFFIRLTHTDLAGIDFLVLRATTTGMTNTMGALYNSSGRELAADDDGGTGMNFALSARLTTIGTYYVRVSSSGSDTGMYRLTVTTTAGDHGNAQAQATPVTRGTAITGNINPNTDEDYFSVVVSSTELAGIDFLTLRATTTGTTDTRGFLYDSEGTRLAADDDGGMGTNFNISYNIATAGTYYVRVSNSGSDTGMYRLTVTATSGDHGGILVDGTPVTSGTAVTGNISPNNDRDWFSIEVTDRELASTDIPVLRAVTTGSLDTTGWLYSSDGRLLASNLNSGTGTNFEILYRVTRAGTYYIRLTSHQDATEGMYSLTVTLMDRDHGNTRASATPAALGTAIAGHIDPDTDEDYFSIVVNSTNLPAAEIIVLRALTTGGTNTIGTIYDSLGNELATDDDGGSTGTNFDVSARVTYYGTYYVKVASESMDTGMYSLTFTATSSDHSDTQGDSATPLRNGETAMGEIDDPDDPDDDDDSADVDYFSIEVPGAGNLTATAESRVDFFLGIITLYGSGGTQLAMAQNDGSSFTINLSRSINTPGTYYVKVGSHDSGKYDLTVTFDSHSDVRTSATTVTSGTAVAGSIVPRTDVDYFEIEVLGPGTLRATTTGILNTTGRLYGSSGNLLATNTGGGTIVGTNRNFDLSHSITTAGTYYISVSSGTTGTYGLTVTFTPASSP